MKNFYRLIFSTGLAVGCAFSIFASPTNLTKFDLSKFHYKSQGKSVFTNDQARHTAEINNLLERKSTLKEATTFDNPAPALTLGPTQQIGNIDAPNGELWYYIGNLEYTEIPPHDNVYYTDRILQSWKFEIYNSKMELIGTIKDKMEYGNKETRVVLCEITPVATRNFFNTDDKVEIIVALGVNTTDYVNNYRSLVYSLNGEKDANGDDVPVSILDDIVGDVIEGPASPDGSDNFYISLMRDIIEYSADNPNDNSFWSRLLAQKASVEVYGKAIDDKGPRLLYQTSIPLIQLPGDQESVPPMMSMLRNNEVVFCISYYKEPFYNRYDDATSEDMTQREGNSLFVELFNVNESGFNKFSSTEIPVVRDPMNDSEGNATCLFSYYSVGSLRYAQDILFDAPGASATAPDFIVTRGNYQVTTDGVTNSYFTYKNNGQIKNTLCLYADGTLAMGNLPGFEPQQMFVTSDAYGYIYNFVNLYSGKTAVKIEADYYLDEDSDPELLTANIARILDGSACKYVFELRYPLVDDNENDILRFLYLTDKGKFDHIDYVNMGKGVAYAQSYLSTEALAPHAYSTSDTPAYMFLVKRGVEGAEALTEEIMIAEAESTENPEGKTLLKLSGNQYGVLASIIPEFETASQPGRLLIYYVDNAANSYTLEIYNLPIESNSSSVTEITGTDNGFNIDNGVITTDGPISVYAIDGHLAASATGSFDTSALNNGIYILVAGGKSHKFIKK